MSFLKLQPHIPWSPEPSIYNCSIKTMEEWASEGVVHTLQGAFNLSLGILLLLLYVIVLIAMTTKDLLNNSCFQMMYFTSCLDLFNILSSNVMSGYFFMRGTVFCTDPVLEYFIGSLGLGSWSGSCASVMFLGLGRLADITDVGKWLFEGKMTFLWMLLSLLQMFFVMFFTVSSPFNSKMGTYFYQPFITENELGTFDNVVVPYTNVFFATVVLITYIAIFIVMYYQKWAIKSPVVVNDFGRRLFLQCCLICSCMPATCYFYSFIEFYSSPTWAIWGSQISFQLAQCTPLISYLVINKTVRNRTLVLLRIKSVQKVTASVSVESNRLTTHIVRT